MNDDPQPASPPPDDAPLPDDLGVPNLGALFDAARGLTDDPAEFHLKGTGRFVERVLSRLSGGIHGFREHPGCGHSVGTDELRRTFEQLLKSGALSSGLGFGSGSRSGPHNFSFHLDTTYPAPDAAGHAQFEAAVTDVATAEDVLRVEASWALPARPALEEPEEPDFATEPEDQAD